MLVGCTTPTLKGAIGPLRKRLPTANLARTLAPCPACGRAQRAAPLRTPLKRRASPFPMPCSTPQSQRSTLESCVANRRSAAEEVATSTAPQAAAAARGSHQRRRPTALAGVRGAAAQPPAARHIGALHAHIHTGRRRRTRHSASTARAFQGPHATTTSQLTTARSTASTCEHQARLLNHFPAAQHPKPPTATAASPSNPVTCMAH